MKRWRGFIVQLLGLIIVPMLIILLVVTYSSVLLHDHEMRLLVSERDERAVRAGAEVLTDRFIQRQLLLKVLAEQISARTTIAQLLQNTPDLRRAFDGGLVLIDRAGTVIDAWQPNGDWSASLHKTASTWVLEHESGTPVVIANAQSTDGSFTLLGGMSLNSLNIPTTLSVMQNNPYTHLYLIADDAHILYAPQENAVGVDAAQIPELQSILSVSQNQSPHHSWLDDADAVVVVSRIEQLNWLLIIREPWSVVVNTTLRLSLIAPLTVIPAMLLAVVVFIFGFMRIVLPMRRLSLSAAKLAWGDYTTIYQPVGGIQEIRDLQTTLGKMTHRVQQMQAGMHSYIGAMLQGQEDERKRIARELHDDTLQALIALDQQRQMAQKQLDHDPARVSTHLATLQEMIDQTIKSLRRLIRDMRPSYLEDLGLVPALEMLCDSHKQGGTVAIHFDLRGTVRRVSLNQELALYRIAQEALSNALRHAKPSNIKVHLSFGEVVKLNIEDDGQGFLITERPDAFARLGHFGLMGMVERAEQVGGQLKVTSKVGQGTSIEIVVDPKMIQPSHL